MVLISLKSRDRRVVISEKTKPTERDFVVVKGLGKIAVRLQSASEMGGGFVVVAAPRSNSSESSARCCETPQPVRAHMHEINQ